MYSEVTSVYVPVKTPDYKSWAILLSVLVHAILLAGVLFFYHSPPPPPMETSLITPEELSQIEGQIRANQMGNADIAGDSASPTSMSDMLSNVAKPSQRDPHTAQMMNDIAAKESAWRKEQERVAQQLDQEVAQEQQQVIDQLNEQQAAEEAALSHNLDAEANADEATKQRIEDIKAYDKDALPKQKSENATSQPTQSMSLGGTGKGKTQGGDSSPTREGSSNGSDRASYRALISSIIKNKWRIPANSNSKLVAKFSISESGVISNVSVSGGNNISQSNLREAIMSSSPLPPPPSSVYSAFRNNTYTFEEK